MTFNITHNIQLPLPGHRLSLYPRNNNPSTMKIAIAHSSYVTFYDVISEDMNTINVPITTVTSIVYCGNGFVYLYPEEDQWVDIYQVSVNGSDLCSSWDAYERTFARVNQFYDTSIYALTPGVSPTQIYKYDVSGSTSNACSMSKSGSPYWGDYTMSEPFWFSYDGSVIFMNTGLVLHSTDNENDDDMTVAGMYTT